MSGYYYIMAMFVTLSLFLGFANNNYHLVNRAPEFNCEQYDFVDKVKNVPYLMSTVTEGDTTINIYGIEIEEYKSLECVK